MKRDDSIYLQHILDAIAKVQIYLLAVDEASFLTDSLVQDGVIRQIEIIGEATKRLSDEVRAQYADVPWDDIAGMRDKLIHDYFCGPRQGMAHSHRRPASTPRRSGCHPSAVNGMRVALPDANGVARSQRRCGFTSSASPLAFRSHGINDFDSYREAQP